MYEYPPWRVYDFGEYVVAILEGESGPDVYDDNVDLEVRFRNGARYGSTFFTLQNVHTLMSSWEATGECSNGLYFNAKHAVIVRELTTEVILAVVADIHHRGELAKWFESLNENAANQALNPTGNKPAS